MRYAFVLAGLLLASAADPALAGPVDTPIPPNPCGAATLKLAFVANEVGTDFGGPPCPAGGSGCAETMVVCHHVGLTTDAPIDVVVELFTAAGAFIPAAPGVACALAPGATAPFVTVGLALPPPYMGIAVPAGPPQVPLGSLRVLSTDTKRIACDVTLIDTTAVGGGFSPGPAGTKDVTVTAKKKGEKGD